MRYLLQLYDDDTLVGYYCKEHWEKIAKNTLFDIGSDNYTIVDIDGEIERIEGEIDDLEQENFHLECDDETTEEEMDSNTSEIWNLRKERDGWVRMKWL